MNVSKLIVGLVVAGFSLASFAIGGSDPMGGDKVDKKAAAVVKYKKSQKEQKKEKMAIHHHRKNQ